MIKLNNFRENIYQNMGIREAPHYSEDGVILKIFSEIKVEKNPLIIEFGETRSLGTTTRAFRIKFLSKAIYFTGNLNLKSNILNILDIFKIIIIKQNIKYIKFLANLPFKYFCDPNNIVELFKVKKVKEIDILTVDIDSYDYFIIKNILENGYRPRLLILEYNWNLPVEKSLAYPFISSGLKPQNKRAYGVSFNALNELATSYEYKLIHVSGFCNLFYIRKDYKDYFETPDILVEIPKSDEDVVEFVEKFCQKGFIPSWLNEKPLTKSDIEYFQVV
jgi:hypothetical protein